MPSLRALGVLPQNDRMVLAVCGSTGIRSFEDIRRLRLPLRIATSVDDGVNFIGYAAQRFMEAHGIDRATLESWGGFYRESVRPEQSLYWMAGGGVDAVLQEAIMTPWWQYSPLSYPLDPVRMARPSLPLHPGARGYYSGNGEGTRLLHSEGGSGWLLPWWQAGLFACHVDAGRGRRRDQGCPEPLRRYRDGMVRTLLRELLMLRFPRQNE